MKKQTKPPAIKRSRLFSGLMVALGGVANAATIEVNDTTCKLVDAIASANTDTPVNGCTTGNGNDIIRLVKNPSAGGLKPTHSLNAQQIDSNYVVGTYVGTPIITSHITIEGEGQQITAQPNPDPFRVFEVNPSGTLILNDVTISGGNDGQGIGSGVLNYAGNLEINQSTFYGNNGAVASIYGTTSINQSVLVSNFAENINYGSAAFIYNSYFTMNNSSVINNRLEYIPPLIGDSPKTLKQILAGSNLPPTTIQLVESESTLTNSTISGNDHFIGSISAATNAPPIVSFQKRMKKAKYKSLKGSPTVGTTLSHLTISNNKGQAGGLFITPNHPITLEGNIISGNKSFINPEYANGYVSDTTFVTVDAHNFIGENGATGFHGLTLGASDVVFSNASEDNLYPLNRSNNTFIHPLKHGSAAIDGLAKSCYQGLFIDQEGKGRGIDGDSNGSFVCDAGAFEHSLPINVSGACTLHNALISANNDGSIGGCQPGNGHDIINLPENSTVTGTAIVESYYLNGYAIGGSGLPVIRSGVVINGNGSTIERDTNAVEDFNMLTVADQNGLILNDSTISGASGNFAAVASWYGSEVQLFNSTITNNNVIGLLSVTNHISGIHYSTITQNENLSVNPYLASGLVSFISNNFQLKNSLIANNVNNSAYGGAQFVNNQNMVLSNNTISGNSGAQVGGILAQGSAGLITHNTITDNEGGGTGGVYISGSISVRLSHNIISGNEITPPVPAPNTANNSQLSLLGNFGMVTPAGGPTYAEVNVGGAAANFTTGNNVLGQNGSSGTTGFTLDASDIVPVGATATVISPTLADNGGPTLTHLPAPGSVAIDAGSNDCEYNVRDQRGYIRPWDGDGDNSDVCDIGAVEANSVAIADLIFKDGFDAVIIVK